MPTTARPARRRTRLLASGAGLALNVAALAGCQQGTAAVVGGERISEADVSTVAAELPALTGGAGSTQASALANMLGAAVITEAAKENGIAVSDDDVRAALADSGADAASLSEPTLRVLAASLVQQRLTDSIVGDESGPGPDLDKISARADELLADADVNPRYGIDTETGQAAEAPAWFVKTPDEG